MTCGRQFEDWSASYRLFEHRRFDREKLFRVPRQAVTDALDDNAPLCVVMDDTLIPKRGKKVADARWRHDPRGPPFNHQIVWGQRLVQLSAVLTPKDKAPHGPRAVPIDLELQSLPKAPPRKATEEQKRLYQVQRRRNAVSRLGAQRVAALRKALDEDGQSRRALIVAVDGGYTNKSLLKTLPPRTTLVGRVRKDAKLFAPPHPTPLRGRGRKRLYGKALPTPEELLRDDSVAWRQTTAFAARQERTFQYKTLGPCRWRGAGGKDLRLIVLRPLSRKPHQAGRRLFFAHPGYLLCTDPDLSVSRAVQAYLWRWEIEVGFREQKTQLGLGQAQTRTRPAVSAVLEFTAYTYALLLLAAHNVQVRTPPRPKWQPPTKITQRITLGQMISLMRSDLWGRALGLTNKNDFVANNPPPTKSPKISDTLQSAVIYATQ